MSILKKIKSFVSLLGLWTAKICTWIMLPIAYWTVFAFTALCMKLFGKPLLPQFSAEEIKRRDTLWLDAPSVSASLEKMKRQF